VTPQQLRRRKFDPWESLKVLGAISNNRIPVHQGLDVGDSAPLRRILDRMYAPRNLNGPLQDD